MSKKVYALCNNCGELMDFDQEENIIGVFPCQNCLRKSMYKILDKIKEIIEANNDLMEEIQW